MSEGGTGLVSYTVGDILVATGSTTLARVPKGQSGYYLQVDPTGGSSSTGGLRWSSVAAPTSGTTSTAGLVQLADNNAAKTGSSTTTAVTPAGGLHSS